ncbi:hypothetical protein [Lentzea sp. NEAU-D7]|uniref:hypothetical protein n=1 Tax=Lentzea sp. NEAU-D7 TaxID=2994667 RepID=UPI00224ABD7D|nr:hypothetical protein [Lentzea sp. NEAU-D7]MCX2949916.1 hypothetical protein [Lentzea sp. NEAU-D7]
MPHLVLNEAGERINEGDSIANFRGMPGTFLRVTRGAEYNGTAKVSVRDPGGWERESYADAWRLRVRTVSEWVAAQDHRAITDENVRCIMELMSQGADHWMDPLNLANEAETPSGTRFTVVDMANDRDFHLTYGDIRIAFLMLADPEQKLVHARSAHYFRTAWADRDADGIQVQDLDAVSGDLVAQVACFGEVRH